MNVSRPCRRLAQRAPGGVNEVAVHPGAVLDRQMTGYSLGREARAVIGLVPDRPERHPRQVVSVPHGAFQRRVVAAAVANPQRVGERAVHAWGGLPVRICVAAGRPRALRPSRRAARHVDVDSDPLLLCVPHDLVPDLPVGGRIRGGIRRVEVTRDSLGVRVGRDVHPADREPDALRAQQPQLRQRPHRVRHQLGVVLEHRLLPRGRDRPRRRHDHQHRGE